MGLSSTEATARLAGIDSIDGLRDLISQIDITAPGDTTVFYSGDAPDGQNFGDLARSLGIDQNDVRIVDHTQVADFLDLESNPDLAAVLENVVGGDPRIKGTPSHQFLNGIADANGKRIASGIWDDVSERFAQDTVGEVRVLTSPKKEFGVFALSELPALLDNPAVTTIDGLPREQLMLLRDSQGIEMVKHAVAANAFAQIDLSGLLTGGFDAYRQLDIGDLANLLKDDATRTALFEKLTALDPQSTVNLETGLSALRQAGEISHINGVSRALNRVGYVGGILSFMLVSAQASAAPSRADAEAIMKQWAVDAAGGEVGAIIASAAAGIAVAAFAAAVTPVAAPVAVALTLGASLIGGFFGAEWASEFRGMLNDGDDAQRRQILDRLTELYFGESTDVSPETLPGAESNFLRVDPALSAAAMYQAASSSPAWRYALVKLNPFVVPDADYSSLHNSNGELDLYDDATREGLTDEYLMARAESLHTYAGLFAAGVDIGAGQPYPGGYDIHFGDADLQLEGDAGGAVVDLHYTSDFKPQRLFGGVGNDLLTGSTDNDMLFGSAGDDRLDGGMGADYLEGGPGRDTYLAGEGDEIFDHDGDGRVMFDGALLVGGTRTQSSGAYESADRAFRYTLTDSNLTVRRSADGAELRITHFINGHMGISLGQAEPPPATGATTIGTGESEIIYGRTDTGVTDFELINGYNLPDHILGQDGRDWIYAWDNGPQTLENGVVVNSAPDTDIVEGGSGRDFIHGGAGDDRLYATEEIDAAAVQAGQGSLAFGGVSNDQGDFVSGQGGDDVIYGSGRVDGLFGGDGDDLIHGGGGDDVIAGDWSAVISIFLMNPSDHDYDWYSFDANGVRQLQLSAYDGGLGNDRIYAGDGDDLVWGGAADDILYGQAGADQLNGDLSGTDGDGNAKLSAQFHGDDFISGGSGNDALNGNGGADILLGGAGNDRLDGDFRVVIGDDALYHGADYLDGGDGDDILTGNGGSDVLLGGNDNDALFGDLEGLDASYHGSDSLYGGDGKDQLVGQGGDDMLYGGGEDDVLYGDDLDLFVLSGDDQLFGGRGADELSGGLGNDLLSGGEGDDSLWGDAGDDRLFGGPGLDYLDGGAGADTYLFSAGDSPEADGQLETLVDSAGQGNTIEFSSNVSADSLEITQLGDSADLILRYAENDAVYLSGGLTGSIETFSFSGGTPISYQSILSAHVPGAIYLEGGDGDDLVFGSDADDRLEGGAGDDRLLGGDGDDLLVGGSGENRLIGGAGSDTYLVAGNPASAASRLAKHEIVDSLDGSSTVRFGAGIEPSDLHLQFFGSTVLISAGPQVLVMADGAYGDLVNRFEFASGDVLNFYELKTLFAASPNSIVGTDGNDVLQGGPAKDVISGGAGDDELLGGAGRDTLNGGSGIDVMAGGTGSDTYIVDHAADLVIEAEAAGYDQVTSSVDYTLPAHIEVLKLAGVNPISGSGNDMGNYITGNTAANLLSGGDGDDRIRGGGGLDVIYGGAGDDELDGLFQIYGGAGNDRIVTSTYISNGSDPIYELAGGPGDDLYVVTQPYHPYDLGVIVEHAFEGIDTLVLRGDMMLFTAGLPDHVENLRYEYSGDVWTGDGVVLVGNELNNRIEIGTPNPGSMPRLYGLAGDDVLIGSNLDESGSEQAGLFGGDGNDRLEGLGGNDRLDGGPGDDVLEGGAGVDVLLGGTGNDTYIFSLGDSQAAAGMSSIEDPDGGSLIRFGTGIVLDDLSFESIGTDLKISYSANDAFLIMGGAGSDQVRGYAFANGDFYSQEAVDRYLQGNSAPVLDGVVPIVDAFEGRPVALTLPSGLFSDPDGDVLKFGLSANAGDTLPSWIDFDDVGNRLQINARDGDAGTYRLSLTAADPAGETASAALTVEIADVVFSSGGPEADLLEGTAAADNLNAGAGDDRLYGYAGNDWLIAGGGADTLYGGQGDDLLRGGAGKDVLKGQAGSDQMLGGKGDDRYYMDSPGDSATELAGEGIDRVYSHVEHRLAVHFEDLVLLGDADTAGTGNGDPNSLYGNSGANTLRGEDGDDRLYGREGDDRLIGGAGEDRLFGRKGDDRLTGGAGDDLLDGGPGDDAYYFSRGDGVDRIRRGTDEELLTGSDSIIFEPAISPDQIWFSRAGDDLLAQLIGSADRIRISGWYLDAPAPVDLLQAGEDAVIAADRVDQLVNAVAGFGVQGAPVIELSPEQQADYSAIVASSWEAPVQQMSA